jgi:hypothetical protein
MKLFTLGMALFLALSQTSMYFGDLGPVDNGMGKKDHHVVFPSKTYFASYQYLY